MSTRTRKFSKKPRFTIEDKINRQAAQLQEFDIASNELHKMLRSAAFELELKRNFGREYTV